MNSLHTLNAELDCERIYAGALRILEQIGLALPSPQTRSWLAGTRGLRFQEERVHVSAELVEPILARMRGRPVQPPPAQWRFSAGSHSHWLWDFDGELRPCASGNLADAMRLIGACASDGVLPGCPGLPTDEPAPLQALVQLRLAAEWFGIAVQPAVDTIPIAEFCIEMLGVFQEPFIVAPHVMSPLRLAGDEWDMAVAFVGRMDGKKVARLSDVGNMPALGLSAPCDYEAAWAQSMAETLGGAAVLHALGAPEVTASATLYPCDLRYGNWVFGSPEHVLITLQEVRLREFCGLGPRYAKSFTTTAVAPNAQAAAEKSLHTAAAALAGYRGFSGVGVLGVDDVWSPAQLMIDLDIAAGVQHLLAGPFKPPLEDILEAVREGLAEETFLTATATLQRHRRLYQTPSVFGRRKLGQWLADGRPDMVSRANALARERLARAPNRPALDAHRAKELNQILDAARRSLLD